ncbi:MAG: ribose transport system permease protein [Chloroflexota bacterium]|nr:ribose transport system permease protein [Chloroflexota bacterium]
MTQSTSPSPVRPRPAIGAALSAFDWRQNIIYIGFLIVFVVFAMTLSQKGFLSSTNLLNVFRQTAIISIMAVAMTFVIGAGHIDLSVGAVAGLSSVTTALALGSWGLPLPAAVVVGLLTGLVVGVANGFLVAVVAIPSFLVTLGMLGIVNGSAQWLSNTAPIPIQDDTFTFIFGSGDIGPIPSLLIWTAVIFAIGHVVLRKTTYGRRVLATGGNSVAARFSGVDTRLITFLVMTVMGLTAGLAGMLFAGRLHSGRFEFGAGAELSVIAAVILGGTSLFGGRATVIGTLLGSLMIGLINNGLTLASLPTSQQFIVRGLIIILAVALAKKR